MVDLGAFRVLTPIEDGGMGRVWRGVHRASNLPVAIKVMRQRNDTFREAFRNEMRVLAALNHPSIVLVLDYGDLPPSVPAPMIEGSPYLVMEFLGGPSLRQVQYETRDWRTLQRVLLGLLDALAHIHARGIVHCDLKPSNVLFGAEGDLRPGQKLTDFGIARRGSIPISGASAGTPHYMAPEQVCGAWREYGPWTDLYSLGCTAWAIVTGKPPFATFDSANIAEAHLAAPLPSFQPRLSVPGPFVEWVARLLEKEPGRRFQRAADAAMVLADLGPTTTRVVSTGQEPLIVAACTTLEIGVHPVLPTKSAPPPQTPTAWTRVPEMTPRWRHESLEQVVPAPLGTGLRLFRHREFPLIGRESAQNLLWQALTGVHRQGGAQVVVLRGAAGAGKTRLATWLCQRAEELGVATAMKAVHSPILGSADGLGPMVARFFGAVGLSANEAAEHLIGHCGLPSLEDPLASAVVQLFQHSSSSEPLARFEVLESLLSRLCQKRPVVLFFDDVQWSLEALGFVEHLLESPALPVLFVLTAQEEALAECVIEKQHLQRIVDHKQTEELVLGPLTLAESRDLVQSFLPLNPELVAQVLHRTQGNPLFAVQLVGDWVRRRIFEETPQGYALRKDARDELPSDLAQMWEQRVGRFLAGRSKDDDKALQAAAVLGREVANDEWELLLAQEGVCPSSGLLRALLDDGLAITYTRAEYWGFVHGMLREAVLLRADHQGTRAAMHLACARLLEKRGSMRVTERLGRHLLEAGQPEAAIGPLLLGGEQCVAERDYIRLASIFRWWQRAMEDALIPHSESRWGEGRALYVWLLMGLAESSEAVTEGEALVRDARLYGWKEQLPDALRYLAYAHSTVGNLQAALDALDQAQALRQEARFQAQCEGDSVFPLRLLGRLEEAEEAARRSLQVLSALGESSGETYRTLGVVLMERDDLEGAAEALEQAIEAYSAAGQRFLTATCNNSLGELARRCGDFKEAAKHYLRSREIYDAFGATRVVYPKMNLGMLYVEQGRYQEADGLLAESLTLALRQERRSFAGGTYVALLPCKAAFRSWELFDRYLVEGRRLLEETNSADYDAAKMAEAAGQLALNNGEEERAARAFALAVAQYEQLGRTDDVARLTEIKS